jgi:hypothetical protein
VQKGGAALRAELEPWRMQALARPARPGTRARAQGGLRAAPRTLRLALETSKSPLASRFCRLAPGHCKVPSASMLSASMVISS